MCTVLALSVIWILEGEFFSQILFTEEPQSGQTLIYVGRAQPLSSVIITDTNNILFSPS